jgi:hypothetical protein
MAGRTKPLNCYLFQLSTAATKCVTCAGDENCLHGRQAWPTLKIAIRCK